MLKTKAKPVDAVTPITILMNDMLETMYAAPALALPHYRLVFRNAFSSSMWQKRMKSPIRMANPEIIQESDDLSVYEEGCLSFPEQYAEVERPLWSKSAI